MAPWIVHFQQRGCHNKILPDKQLRGQKFYLTHSSQGGIIYHSGWAVPCPQEQGWTGSGPGYKASRATPSNPFPPANSTFQEFHLPSKEEHHQLGTSCSDTRDDRGHFTFKPKWISEVIFNVREWISLTVEFRSRNHLGWGKKKKRKEEAILGRDFYSIPHKSHHVNNFALNLQPNHFELLEEGQCLNIKPFINLNLIGRLYAIHSFPPSAENRS